MYVCVHAHAHMCVCAGVRAYPPVCVCTFLGSARELTGAEKTASVTEETDIDAEEVSQAATAEESNLNRGVTDLDATAKTTELNHSESKVSHPKFARNLVAEGVLFHFFGWRDTGHLVHQISLQQFVIRSNFFVQWDTLTRLPMCELPWLLQQFGGVTRGSPFVALANFVNFALMY